MPWHFHPLYQLRIISRRWLYPIPGDHYHSLSIHIRPVPRWRAWTHVAMLTAIVVAGTSCPWDWHGAWPSSWRSMAARSSPRRSKLTSEWFAPPSVENWCQHHPAISSTSQHAEHFRFEHSRASKCSVRPSLRFTTVACDDRAILASNNAYICYQCGQTSAEWSTLSSRSLFAHPCSSCSISLIFARGCISEKLCCPRLNSCQLLSEYFRIS